MSCVPTVLVSVLLALVASSCVRVPQADDKRVAALVQKRIDKHVCWHKDDEILSYINFLLEEDIDCGAAVQIALLNNPRIQASFEEIGVAQADVIQAGLFRNPILAGFVRFPVNNNSATNTEISATQSFIELFLIPLRKKVAEREFEKAQAQAAHMVVELAFDVQECFYTLQAELAKHDLLEQLAEIQLLSHTIKERQYNAGNTTQLAVQASMRELLEAKLALSVSKNVLAELGQRLNELLGMRLTQQPWHIVKQLPELPRMECKREVLEKRAFSQRLDLAKQRLELKRLFEMGETKRWWAYTNPEVGVSYEKDAEGLTGVGPSLSMSLPFFDHGQADRARLIACLKQSQHELVAKELEVAKEVRLGYERLVTNRAKVELLQNELVPLQEQMVAMSQKYYNVMGLGVYQLLQAKQQELQARVALYSALQEYWQSKISLERAVGGQI